MKIAGNHNNLPPFGTRRKISGRGESDTAAEFATAIVDEFLNCGGSDKMQTMSLTDLDRYPTFAEAMTEVANELIESLTAGIEDDIIVSAVTVINGLSSDYGDGDMVRP